MRSSLFSRSALLLLLVPSLLLLVNTASGQATVNVYPSEGPPGVLVEVFGCGFARQTSVAIYFEYVLVAEERTDAAGCFWALVAVPRLEPGLRAVIVRDTSGRVAYTSFTVTRPLITVSPSTGPAGSRVNITGVGLGPYQVYTLKFNDVIVESLLFTSESGELVGVAATVPTGVSPGVYNFTLTYIGYYREVNSVRQVFFTSQPVVVAYAPFNVTRGAATTDDILLLNESISKLAAELSSLRDTIRDLVNWLERLGSEVRANTTLLNSALRELAYRLNTSITSLEELTRALSAELNKTRSDLSRLRSDLNTETSKLDSKILDLKNTLSIELEKQSSRIRSLESNYEFARILVVVASALGAVSIALSARVYIAMRRYGLGAYTAGPQKTQYT